MSTERSVVVRSIRRIVLQAPALRQAMDAIQSRGDQAASVGVGTSDADRDRICCDGSTSSNPNPGADSRDTSESQDGLDSGDPADIGDMDGGCLSGVTDCGTGEPICFCGSDWVPPEGWDSPTTPPVDPEFEEGVYYQVSREGGGNPKEITYHQTCSEAIEQVQEWSCIEQDVTSCIGWSNGSNCDDGYTISLAQMDCLEDPNPICDEEPPLAESWPEDSCINLAIKKGTIVGSKYDPDHDGSYSKPRDEIELCDDAGNRILLRGSPSGGWKSIKSLDGDIDPDTGNGYLYGPSGKRIRQISPSEFRDDTV